MIRFLIPVAVLLSFVPVAPAQEPAYRDDLRFAEALRNRGDNDLALEFLQQLAKGAPPDLLKELSLEFAKTRLRVAADEPESAKRLAQYHLARKEFEKFIADNPGHPRLAEANIDIARVLNFTGKTELNQAVVAEERKTKRELATQARATLEQAAVKLAAAGKELQDAVTKLPDPDGIKDVKEKRAAEAVKLRAETEVQQTELDRALNLYDQAACYTLVGNDQSSSDTLIEAKKLLAPIASGSPRQSITWKARAWLGRIDFETESTDKAHARFQEVIPASNVPAAADGIRLAKYFRLKVIQKSPREDDRKKGVNSTIIASARNWRSDYRRYWNTPEGHGITFMLAETLIDEAQDAPKDDPKEKKLPAPKKGEFRKKELTPLKKAEYRQEARRLLRELENSENEFTDRARRMKIGLMNELGVFKIPVEKLAKFEDLYVRSQFEASKLAGETTEDGRKARIANILKAIEKALATPEAKKMQNSLELNTARSTYIYWALNTGKLVEAIKVGEQFARDDPRSSQAEMSAVYALQAYGQVVSQNKDAEDAPELRSRMFSFAGYMEDRWPTTIAGEIARHSIGLQLLREENFREAIKKLSLIGPGYGSYTLVCFQISDACAKAEKASLEPIIGDQKGDYKKRALQALLRMPDSALLSGDPLTNQLFISGKATLGRELFRFKRFQQMNDLAAAYLARIDKLTFNDDKEKNLAILNQLRFELVDVKLFASYGLADAAFQASNHELVLEILDPLVDAPADSQEKTNLQKNPTLGTGLFILALRSTIQLGKIDRTDAVLNAIESVSGEEGAGDTKILKLLSFLIRGQVDEIRTRNDKVALATAVDGYVKILKKRTAKAKAKSTPELIRAVADCYSSMGRHAEAAAQLEKTPDPKAKPGTDEEKSFHRVQLLLSQEYRLSKDKANFAKARKLMNAIMGDAKTPDWGRKDLLALIENGNLLEAEEKYADAFALWKNLVRRLQSQIGNPAVKAKFLDCYFHMILSYYKDGMTKAGKDERDKVTAEATIQLANFEKSYGEDFGNEAVKKQVDELLAKEAALKAAFEASRKKK
jgi:hypothetical protein